jgi:hypothetical protein
LHFSKQLSGLMFNDGGVVATQAVKQEFVGEQQSRGKPGGVPDTLYMYVMLLNRWSRELHSQMVSCTRSLSSLDVYMMLYIGIDMELSIPQSPVTVEYTPNA